MSRVWPHVPSCVWELRAGSGCARPVGCERDATGVSAAPPGVGATPPGCAPLRRMWARPHREPFFVYLSCQTCERCLVWDKKWMIAVSPVYSEVFARGVPAV